MDKEKRLKPPTFGVVYIGQDLRCCKSLIAPVCTRIGGRLEATFSPDEAVQAVGAGTFPQEVGLILFQPLHQTNSLLEQVRDYGVGALTFPIASPNGCWPNASLLALNIQQALANQEHKVA